MADHCSSTSRRAVLTGIAVAIPLAAIPQAVAAPVGPTEVERAWLAFLVAMETPLQNGDSMYLEEADFIKAKPVNLNDVILKARYANSQWRSGGSTWPTRCLMLQIGAMA
jgi:hypothetical protein